MGRARQLFPLTQPSHEEEDQEEESLREESEEDEELSMEDPWTTTIDQCEVGAFAAVHSHYENAFGLSIVKVLILKIHFQTRCVSKRVKSVSSMSIGKKNTDKSFS